MWHNATGLLCHRGTDILVCDIFELFFTLCHKCNKYNRLPWKMLNHAGNSYTCITHRKRLCHPPDTVMSHRRQLYHPFVYMVCILIRSGSRSNDAVAKQSKYRSGILKRNEESRSSVFHSIWLCFYLKMSHIIYHTSSWATIPEWHPLGDTKALARYVTLCLWHQVP